MNKDTLSTLCNQGFSQREIAEQLNTSQSNIRYWLKKHNLVKQTKTTKYCCRCSSEKPLTDFYQRRGKFGGSVYCKPCTNDQTIERQRNIKKQLVDYKGGKCQICGYSKYIGALDFHHLNTIKKEFNLSRRKCSSIESLKSELDKCICLCANCHREVHGKVVGLPGLEPRSSL